MTDSDEIYLRPVNPNCKCRWCAYLMDYENVHDKTRYCSFLDKYVALDSLCPEFICSHKYSERLNKRFKGLISIDGAFKKVRDKYTNKDLTIKECIDMMNELNDENRKLKKGGV